MSSKPARPQRSAETIARSYHSSGTTMDDLDKEMPRQKKPRFDLRNPSTLANDTDVGLDNDPDLNATDTAILDADVIGPGRGNLNTKRHAVNIDGYDSDSENENFDARADAKARRENDELRTSKLEEETDMFADLEEDFAVAGEDEAEAGGKRKKKAVRFLEEHEIEGQEDTSKAGGHVHADFVTGQNGISAKGKGKGKRAQHDDAESSSDESDVSDTVRAAADDSIDTEIGAGGKKQHAPKLDAFNMRTENEEGRFDEQGNYVRKAVDPDAVHDSWLEGLSKRDMRQAKEAAEKREADRRTRQVEDDAVLNSELLKTLILNLKRGETLLEALARLGKGKDNKPKWETKYRNRRKPDQKIGDAERVDNDPAETQRRETVESVTDAADRLLSRGQPEIYDTERELLIRQYQRETGEVWAEPGNNEEHESAINAVNKNWEYRWFDARDGGQIHGPYDGPIMQQWKDAGYFGDGVEFREKDANEAWSRFVNFV